jgi:DNA-binding transcriptional ArsR family regulator
MQNDLGSLAALIGEPIRANILWALLDGRAYTASELAVTVNTTPQNLSMHLSKLIKADLLSVEIQGRHRYYAFSRPEVAYAVESLAGLLPPKPKEDAVKEDPPIRTCRTCYDHLAGRVGVALTESLVKQKILDPNGKEFNPTTKGIRWFQEMGIDCEALKEERRSFARACLDWTERRPHLAGSLGAAILQKMFEDSWLRRMANTRAVLVTPKGRKRLNDLLHLSI